MPVFEYQAFDTKRKQKKGILEADTERHARQLVRKKGLFPTAVKRSEGGGKKIIGVKKLFSSKYRLKPKEIITVTRQLANLIQASLPVDEALETIAEHNNSSIKRVLSETRSMVVEGKSLSQALSEQQVFDPQYASSIAAGEQSGQLSKILEKMADDTDRHQKFFSKMKTAMIYPASIALVSIMVVIALLTYVVPQVVEVFVNTSRSLPTLTVIMINISDFLRNNSVILLSLLGLSLITFQLALKVSSIKERWHRFVSRIPVIGKIFIGTNNAQFCRTFSLMQLAGVPVIETMRITANTLTSLPMKNSVLKASDMVREGSSIFKALEKFDALPPMTLYMLASGEVSGTISNMLERAAINQEQDLDNFTATLLGIFEPAIILIMGGVVLTIVLSILLPIFELNQLL